MRAVPSPAERRQRDYKFCEKVVALKRSGAKLCRMEEITMVARMGARREQLLRELQSDMADLVESGDLSDIEANEWVNRAADRWAHE